jgi:hypothetical protein
MRVRYNESTPNRPWGERPLDAPVVPIDLHAYMQEIMEEGAWQKNDRNAITVFKSKDVTVTLVALHRDAEMKPPVYARTGIMTLQVLDGLVSFSTANEKMELYSGQMVILHEHIPYIVLALEESSCLLTMTREAKTLS